MNALPGRPLRGALLVMTAVLVFAGMDAITKHLAMAYNVPMVLALRYIVHLLLLAALFAPRQGRTLFRVQRSALVLLRAASLTVASFFAGIAFRQLPIAEATAIVYLAPLLVMALAGPVLGETVGWQRWLAAGAGFAGVLLIARPGSGLEPVGVICALLAAALSATYFVLSRLLAPTESTLALVFHTALVGAVLFCAMLPWYWISPSRSGLDVALFPCIGAMALTGHYLLTAAFREAPASLLAPFNYLHLVWAGALGWLVFGHIPDAPSLLGLALVAAAGAGIALWTHISRPTAIAAPAL